MNDDKKENAPVPVPESLKRAGITRVVSNLKEDEEIILPRGLITTLFKEELLEKLTKK